MSTLTRKGRTNHGAEAMKRRRGTQLSASSRALAEAVLAAAWWAGLVGLAIAAVAAMVSTVDTPFEYVMLAGWLALALAAGRGLWRMIRSGQVSARP